MVDFPAIMQRHLDMVVVFFGTVGSDLRYGWLHWKRLREFL
jgi:hypothetical protein